MVLEVGPSYPKKCKSKVIVKTLELMSKAHFKKI